MIDSASGCDKKDHRACAVVRWTGLFLCLLCMVSGPVAALSWEEQRREMVAEIRDNAVATARYIGNKPFDPRVMEAMNAVPRHEFVPVLRKPLAYRNQP